MTSGSLQHFVLYDLQLVALSIFALLYGIKIWQLVRLPVPKELPPPLGNLTRAVASSYFSIFNPRSMESTRKAWGHWLAFSVYHAGILVAILATFTIPFAPGVMTGGVRRISALLIGLAFVAGAFKLAWRLSRPEMRLVSTPDDYFSLIVLQVWFVAAVPAILFDLAPWLLAYFIMTALLLIYVPLSKISHYVYWFFARYLFGQRYGRRGLI